MVMGALVLNGLLRHLDVQPPTLTHTIFTYLLILCLLLSCFLLVILTFLLRTRWERSRQAEAARERYYLLAQLAGAYLFDYNYENHTLQLNGDGAQEYMLTLHQTLPMCHPDDHGKLESLLRTPPPRRETCVLEFRLRRDVGAGYHWYECKAMAVLDKRGHPMRLLGRLENIERRKIREDALVSRATLDSLTNLLNKSAIALRTDEFLTSPCGKEGGALLMLDLDNFKAINDNCGHSSGDQALLLTAQVLRDSFRRIDLLGRAGGDEFLVFLPGHRDRQAVQEKAYALCHTLEEAATASLGQYAFTCSVGVAFAPEDGDRFSSLFDGADTAMYTAKRSGKNTCVLFESNP